MRARPQAIESTSWGRERDGTLTTAAGNGALDALLGLPGGIVLVVAGNVLVTFLAGVVFCLLRIRSGSLLAPALAHLATNDASLVVGWLSNR